MYDSCTCLVLAVIEAARSRSESHRSRMLHGERNLEVYDSGDSVNTGSEDKEYGGGDTDALVKKPCSFA